MGTVISSLVLFLYSYPKYVYMNIFKRKYSQYLCEILKYVFITLFNAIVTIIIVNKVNFVSNINTLLIRGIIIMILPNLINYFIMRKTEEWNYLKDIIKEFIPLKG